MYAAQAIPELQTVEKLVDAAKSDINTGLVIFLIIFALTALVFILSNKGNQKQIVKLVQDAMDNKREIGAINEHVASVAEAQRSIVTVVNDQLKPISELADAWINALERTQTATAEALSKLQHAIDGIQTIALENKQLIEDNNKQQDESFKALHEKVDQMSDNDGKILDELREMNRNLKALMIQIENTLVAIQDAAKKKTSEVETVNPEDSAPDAS